MKFLKSQIALILVSLMFTTISFAEYEIISTERESEFLSPAIKYEHRLDFTDKGFININVLRMNYNDPNSKIKLLKSDESISKRETVMNMVNKADNVYGATNGDFFDYNYKTALGPMVQDGIVYSSPINNPEFSSFNITQKGRFFIENWDLTLFKIKKGYHKYKVDYINKPFFNGDRIILFNRDWSSKSIGNTHNADILEILVVDNTIQSINFNKEPIEIPENGYVLSVVGSKIDVIKNDFKVFDKIEFINDVNFDFIDFAVGGGTRLLKDGKIVDKFTLNLNGRHPRTALGYNDNNEIILATVDGRNISYKGVTQTELANIMLSLGCTNAINLDGGGSTTMIKKDILKNIPIVVNHPSDSSLRKVQNAVAFTGSYPISEPHHISLSPASKEIFVNDSVLINYALFDKNYNLLTPTTTPTFEVIEGNGYFKDNMYFPNESGIHKIKIYYSGIENTTSIHVLKNIAKINIIPNNINLETNQNIQLKAIGISSDGYSAPIKIENIVWCITGGVGEMTNQGVFTSSDKNSTGAIRASFNKLDTFIPVNVGFEEKIIHDFETTLGEFTSYPKEVTGKYYQKHLKDRTVGTLVFDFNNTDKTRAAYIDFKDKIKLDSIPKKLAISVFGDYGNNHKLKMKLKDSLGEELLLEFDKPIEWEGWQDVELSVPQHLTAPINIERIYMVETNPLFKDNGFIMLDNLKAQFIPSSNTEVPNSTNLLPNIDEFIILGKQVNYTVDSESFKSNNFSSEKINNTTLLKINNKNGGIRKNDYKQWINILNELKSDTDSPILMVLCDNLKFTDPLEEKLLYDELEKINNTRKTIIVYPNKDNSYTVNKRTAIIGINNNSKLNFHLDDKISFELEINSN